MKQDLEQVAALLHLLSNKHRLAILCALEQGEKSVGELCTYLAEISMSGLSQHLTLMKGHGLIDSEKKAQTVRYHIADPRILQLMHTLRFLYCQENTL